MIVARQTSNENQPNPGGVTYFTPLGLASRNLEH